MKCITGTPLVLYSFQSDAQFFYFSNTPRDCNNICAHSDYRHAINSCGGTPGVSPNARSTSIIPIWGSRAIVQAHMIIGTTAKIKARDKPPPDEGTAEICIGMIECGPARVYKCEIATCVCLSTLTPHCRKPAGLGILDAFQLKIVLQCVVSS